MVAGQVAKPPLSSYALPDSVRFPTTLGRVLHGRVFAGREAAERSVVILGALAAPQRYLNHLALWLSSQGYGVLTFDYRGVGQSIFAGDPTTNLDEWGDDALAAIRAAHERFAPRKLLVLGHSLGGMLLGHAGVGGEARVDGSLLVAASQGLPHLYRGLSRIRIETAYRVLPRIANVLGELPGWRFLLKARVPRDVVIQWARWGREGRFSRWSGESSQARFDAVRGPLLSVQLADDDFAPVATVDALVRHFRFAGVRREVLTPRGRERLGHFGLFANQAPTWVKERVVRWLQELEGA